LDELVAQVLPVLVHRDDARTVAEQEREDRFVGLRRVAGLAAEHEVVAAVVGREALARRDVVERDRALGHDALAVRADGAVAREQPLAGFDVRGAPGGHGSERGLLRGGLGAAAAALSAAAAAASARAAGSLLLGRAAHRTDRV